MSLTKLLWQQHFMEVPKGNVC